MFLSKLCDFTMIEMGLAGVRECRRGPTFRNFRKMHQEPGSQVFLSQVRGARKKLWRRGWDLNPRYPLRYVRFRGGSFQPLTHLSEQQLPVARNQLPGEISCRF